MAPESASDAARSYVVVGGSRGIGAALVARLLGQGHQVTTLCRSSETVPEGAQHVSVDVTQDAIPVPDGEVHGLVYCPGSITLKPFRGLKESDFQADFDLNVLGATRVLGSYFKALRSAGDASVVLFSTVAVQTGMANHASIAAAKGAVEGLTRSLAAEWAPKIRVNAIAPSLTDTPLATRLLQNEAMSEAAAKRHPMERIGSADEIAGYAEFLLGPDSGWISGQVLAADGGMSALRRF